MKFGFKLISDTIFFLFLSFTLFLIVLNYFLAQPFSLIFSIVLSLLVALFVVKKSFDNNRINGIKIKARKQTEDMITQFNLSSVAENLNFFERFINGLGHDTERKRNAIFLKDKNAVVFLSFGYETVGKSQIVKAFNSVRKNDVAFILSESFCEDAKSFAKRFSGRIVLVDKDDLYLTLSSNNALPENKFSLAPEKEHGLKLFKNLLKKSKAKSYLAFGLVCLATSYFVPIKLYYVIFGCVFLTAALLARLFGRENTDR